MGGKRKREESHLSKKREKRRKLTTQSLTIQKPSIFLGCSFPEVDKIMEQRSSSYVVIRGRSHPSLSCTTLLGNNKTVAENLSHKLPEDILCSIVSLLSLREAARTSILATTWRDLWRGSTNLDFDAMNMTGNHLDLHQFHRQNTNLQQQQKARFVGWVNQILKLHCRNEIQSFRVEYPLAGEYGTDVDQWIQFAVDKKVQNIDINLAHCMPMGDHELYKFPYWLFAQVGGGSTIQHLSLTGCTLNLPPNFTSLNSLTSLSLRNTRIDEASVQNILSSCPWLQWFSIQRSICSTRLKFASEHSFLRLKHVDLDACFGLKEIEFHNATSLVSFEYSGRMLDPLLFKNSAQPVRVCLRVLGGVLTGEPCALAQLGTYFPHLETLILNCPNIEVDMTPKPIPTFTNLTQLVLGALTTESFLELTSSLLEAAPLLVKLELDLPFSVGNAKKILKEKTTNILQKKLVFEGYCRHERLKEVKLFNFYGYQHEFDLVICLLNNAIALAKMRIDRERRLYRGNGEWLIGRTAHLRITRKQVYKILHGEVGFVNSLAFAKSGQFLIAGVGQEPSLGGWGRLSAVRNGVAVQRLKLS